MRIIQITPGSGDNFYCENCLRDAGLARALRELGHDVALAPLYLPPRLEETGRGSAGEVFFGGINVYLQEKWGLFRHTPRWLDRLFDGRRLLAWAARRAGMTDAGELGRTTISILRGEEGRQKKELARLTEWLEEQGGCEVVVLSNALLLGLARALGGGGGRAGRQPAVVCWLQDEDEFLDDLEEPYRSEAWGLLRERARDVEAFVAVSRYYAEAMGQRLGLDERRLEVVRPGVRVEEYEGGASPGGSAAPTIGYLSRMCAAKGLDLLVEAFLQLRQEEELGELRLRVAGGSLGDDRGYVAGLRRQIAEAGASGAVEWVGSFEREDRIAFLHSLTVLCVPARRAESYGLYALEAMAAGVPVVGPASGVFPELLALTGGGILVEPNDAGSLRDGLRRVLTDRGWAEGLGQRGRQGVRQHFDARRSARQTAEAYERAWARRNGREQREPD